MVRDTNSIKHESKICFTLNTFRNYPAPAERRGGLDNAYIEHCSLCRGSDFGKNIFLDMSLWGEH